MTQTVYAAHIETDEGGGGDDARVCHGRGCFTATHVIILGTCFLGALSQAVVAWRTRALYRRIWQHQRAAARAGRP